MTNTWKSVELTIAKMFHTQRNPLSGSNSKHSRSDTLHEMLYIEIKHGNPKNFRLNSIFEKTVELAREEGKVPVLIFHPIGKRINDSMVAMRLEDLLRLIGENSHQTAHQIEVIEK